DRDLLSGLVDPAGPISSRARARIHLDLAVDQVDDPVDRDATPGIGRPLLTPVAIEGALRDLDQQCDIRRSRVACAIGLTGPPDDREVWFRLVKVRDAHRALF